MKRLKDEREEDSPVVLVMKRNGEILNLKTIEGKFVLTEEEGMPASWVMDFQKEDAEKVLNGFGDGNMPCTAINPFFKDELELVEFHTLTDEKMDEVLNKIDWGN